MKFPNRPSWVARRKPKTVFVFSGGAVRGAAQIGMLKALCEVGIKPDEIVGVSIGALNGFWFACDPTLNRANELERLWLEIIEDPPISGNILRRITSILRGKPSFDTGEKLKKFLENNVPAGDLSQTKIPFHLGTTSASTGLINWWDKGPSVDLLRASAALPGLLPAVQLKDSDYHLDGGVVSNIPLRKAISLKPTRIVVLDVATGFLPPEKQTAISLMMVGFRAASAELSRQEWADVPKNVKVIHIGIQDPDGDLDINFENVPNLIKEGEKVARKVLLESLSDVAN
jgi:NTE family protein